MVRSAFGSDGRIRLLEAEGDPPERYKLDYRVRSLVVQGGEVRTSMRHLVEIYLTLAYPRQTPQCRMLSPVFHPNIGPHAICIGDHWSAAESLGALIIRIAEMLTYQSYNIKSPLNGEAARWAEEHISELPLERMDFGRLLAAPSPGSYRQESGPAPKTPGRPVGSDGQAAASATSPPELPQVTILETGSREPLIPGPAREPPHPDPRRDDRSPATEGLEIQCGTCGAALSLPSSFSQTWARCPLCGRIVQIGPR